MRHRLTPPGEVLLKPGYLAAVVIVAAIALGSIAVLIGKSTGAGNIWWKLSELLLQTALITAVGGLLTAYVKSAFDHDANKRADRRKQFDTRLEFLRRMGRAHSTVEYAARLIRAHDSVDTYFDQLRTLMLLISELWEIHQDLVVANRLFAPKDEEIRRNIRRIIDFLECGADEYERFYRRMQGGSTGGGSLGEVMRQQGTDLEWVRKLIDPNELDERHEKRRLPGRYEVALNNSKGTMRDYIHGSTEHG